MYGDQKFKSAVQSFVDDVDKSPSTAVGAGLERLKQALRDNEDGTRLAHVAPVANLTWMNRATLFADNLDSEMDSIEIPFACRLLGTKITTLLIDAGEDVVEPPPEAIDIFIQINRRDQFTARTDKLNSQTEDSLVVSLLAIDTQEANRQMCISMPKDSVQVVSVRFRWAVDLATVAAFGWGDTQISVNWFVDPLGESKVR